MYDLLFITSRGLSGNGQSSVSPLAKVSGFPRARDIKFPQFSAAWPDSNAPGQNVRNKVWRLAPHMCHHSSSLPIRAAVFHVHSAGVPRFQDFSVLPFMMKSQM